MHDKMLFLMSLSTVFS